MAFVQQVADIAEDIDHHPDILIHDYNRVKLTTISHDANQLTTRDFRLAELFDDRVVDIE